MTQRRKPRILAALALTAGAFALPAATAGAAPWDVNWQEFSSLEEFESACSAMHGTPDRSAWTGDAFILCRTRWHVWEIWPMGWRGPEAQRALWARYGPPSHADSNDCPGCGGGGSW